MLSLSNFKNTCDPEILDAGNALLKSEKILKLEQESKNEFVASVAFQGKVVEVFVGLGARGKIEELYSSEQESTALGADTITAPAAAVLMAVQQQLEAEKKPKKQVKKRQKDVALSLLDEVEAAQLKEFVKEMVKKDKGFKSQFMLFFSELDEVDEKQYLNIILDAIKAVKGRKKQLTAGEASKIVSALTPLLNQATEAEAKGHFKEAYAIDKLFLLHVIPLEKNIKTESKRFADFKGRVEALLLQIANNKKPPADFKDFLWEDMKNQFAALIDVPSSLRNTYFNAWISCSKFQNKIKLVVDYLENDLDKYTSENKKRNIYLSSGVLMPEKVQRLVRIYLGELNNIEAALNIMKKHAQDGTVQLHYLKLLLKKGRAEEAYEHISNNKTKENIDRLLRSNSEFQSLYIRVLAAVGKQKKAGDFLEKLIEDSNYSNLDHFRMMKENLDNKEWKSRFALMYDRIKKSQSHPKKIAALHIISQLGNYKELSQKIVYESSFEMLFTFGESMLKDKPDLYLLTFERVFDKISSRRGYRYGFEASLLKYAPQIARIVGGERVAAKALDWVISEGGYYARAATALKQQLGL